MKVLRNNTLIFWIQMKNYLLVKVITNDDVFYNRPLIPENRLSSRRKFNFYPPFFLVSGWLQFSGAVQSMAGALLIFLCFITFTFSFNFGSRQQVNLSGMKNATCANLRYTVDSLKTKVKGGNSRTPIYFVVFATYFILHWDFWFFLGFTCLIK